MSSTLQSVKEAFEEAGVSVSDWADAHGFRRENVYAVLSGRTKGRRGQSHRIAAALGLKREIDIAHALGNSLKPEQPPVSQDDTEGDRP